MSECSFRYTEKSTIYLSSILAGISSKSCHEKKNRWYTHHAELVCGNRHKPLSTTLPERFPPSFELQFYLFRLKPQRHYTERRNRNFSIVFRRTGITVKLEVLDIFSKLPIKPVRPNLGHHADWWEFLCHGNDPSAMTVLCMLVIGRSLCK